MNIDLCKKAKNDFQKYFIKLINNAVFRKTVENDRKHRDLNLLQKKEEETIWYQNQILQLKRFLQQIYKQQK